MLEVFGSRDSSGSGLTYWWKKIRVRLMIFLVGYGGQTFVSLQARPAINHAHITCPA